MTSSERYAIFFIGINMILFANLRLMKEQWSVKALDSSRESGTWNRIATGELDFVYGRIAWFPRRIKLTDNLSDVTLDNLGTHWGHAYKWPSICSHVFKISLFAVLRSIFNSGQSSASPERVAFNLRISLACKRFFFNLRSNPRWVAKANMFITQGACLSTQRNSFSRLPTYHLGSLSCLWSANFDEQYRFENRMNFIS